jgi:integrase
VIVSDTPITNIESAVPSPAAGNADSVRSKELTPIAVTVKQAAPDVTTTRSGLTYGLEHDTLRSSNATAKRTRKSMSRRRGQNGHIEKSGRWFVVRFWQDVAGQEKRALVRVRICPVSGTGSLNASERKRRAKQIVQDSGADTVEHFERTVLHRTGVTFREQAERWYEGMSSRKSKPVRPSTLASWDGIIRNTNETLGDLPLAALVEDQTPVRDFVQMMYDEDYEPKTIRNYLQVIKVVVASAKDLKSRKRLFPVAWDDEYIDAPAVGEQRTPSVVGHQMSLIVERAQGLYRVMLAVKAASGLRFGEILGLKIENVLDDCSRLYIIEKLWKNEQQGFLKTPNGKRYVELHSSIAALLRKHIGQRKSGYVFCTDTNEPLDQSNILQRVLHPILMGDENTPGIVVNINDKSFTGVKAGAHIFRRFRNSHLRASKVPAGLLKYWMGHSRKQDMTDVYDKSVEDTAWRAEIAEQIGAGFTVPSCTECTEKEKEATGAVASK